MDFDFNDIASTFANIFSGVDIQKPAVKNPTEPDKPSYVTPIYSVVTDGKNAVISVEMPGVEQKDIDLEIEKNTITVTGERKIGIPVKYGITLRVRQDRDMSKVSAKNVNGLLLITVPEKEADKPEKVKINIQ